MSATKKKDLGRPRSQILVPGRAIHASVLFYEHGFYMQLKAIAAARGITFSKLAVEALQKAYGKRKAA